MFKKKIKEWNVETSWGKVAMVSWGDPANPPILLIHGYMDSAATFTLLVDQLPDTYYYVGFDMPGHGKSDPFPPGMVVSLLHVAEAIRRIVEYMDWDTFIFIAHSMGAVIGYFYSFLFPGKVKKMIQLDPKAPISMYYFVHYQQTEWYQRIYKSYYDNYERYKFNKPKLYTYDEAISLIVRNRSLSEEQADVVLSRSLVPTGNDKYKLSWEPRMKIIANIPVSEETLYTAMTANPRPILIINVTEYNGVSSRSDTFASNLFQKCQLTLPNFVSLTVSGGHDVHITNPERLVKHIVDFLNQKFENLNTDKKSKL